MTFYTDTITFLMTHQEEQHQEDLRMLQTRLAALDKVQHRQLAEMTSDLTPRSDLKESDLTTDFVVKEKKRNCI